MDDWNFDISAAPKGKTLVVNRTIGKKKVDVSVHEHVLIIAAGSDDVVTLSRWLPSEGRWNMFTKAVPPIAWKPWPAHPRAKRWS